MIFNIQRFSTHDGPGIRTVVFLKGCPLRCAWCENPESQSTAPDLLYDERLCIGCLECSQAAVDGEVSIRKAVMSDGTEVRRPVFDRSRILDPEVFRGICPSEALTVVGANEPVRAIVDAVVKDQVFYGIDGGATFSGGEPFMQPALLVSLMKELDERGINVAIETSLQVPWTAVEPTLTMNPLLLADVKHVDAEKYRSWTGGGLSVVLQNFQRLASSGARVVARVPVIPGFNDDSKALRDILEFVSSLSNVKEVHLLPYHTMGRAKYDFLGRDYRMGTQTGLVPDVLEPVARIAAILGLRVSIGG